MFPVIFIGASVPVNLTVLHESFQWVNLTWDTPQCPNGIINYYRVCYYITLLIYPNTVLSYLSYWLDAAA